MLKDNSHHHAAAKIIAGIIVLCMLSIPCAGSASVGHQQVNCATTPDCFQEHPDFLRSTLLIFFIVKGGKTSKIIHTLADLRDKPEIVVDGYVAGIVVLGSEKLDSYVGGEEMDKVSLRNDGTLFFEYFGTLDPNQVYNVSMENEREYVQGYSFFPKITGDTVSSSDRFVIGILKKGARFDVTVHQNGYRNLPISDLLPEDMEYRFRFIGDRDYSLQEKIPDFEARIRSVAEGIADVEEAFRIRMIRNVNIVDYEGIHNALTRSGDKDIWFFTETFCTGTVSELKTMARHEALHLLVDEFEFTQSSEVREIFADLKGYGDFSIERFLLMTQGRNRSKTVDKDQIFFAFINEKNFLAGSSGGHSQDNLDEFCTSFFHSLMYSGEIKKNLDHPRFIGADESPFGLRFEEKRQVIEYYQKIIRAFIGSVRPGNENLEKFLESKYADVTGLMDDFTWAENRSPIRLSPSDLPGAHPHLQKNLH